MRLVKICYVFFCLVYGNVNDDDRFDSHKKATNNKRRRQAVIKLITKRLVVGDLGCRHRPLSWYATDTLSAA